MRLIYVSNNSVIIGLGLPNAFVICHTRRRSPPLAKGYTPLKINLLSLPVPNHRNPLKGPSAQHFSAVHCKFNTFFRNSKTTAKLFLPQITKTSPRSQISKYPTLVCEATVSTHINKKERLQRVALVAEGGGFALGSKRRF